MGCDIHPTFEVRRDGVWHAVANGNPDAPWHEDPFDIPLSYQLFGVLAGVRDHTQSPIQRDRGMPEDASPEAKADAEYWADDGHSHGWVTLAELNATPW